jgi:aminopeptidase N
VWLNEALATYFQYKSIASIYPDWDIENQFIDTELLQTMWDDGFPSSTPIKVEVKHPEDFYRLYDPIKNSKGAAIIRMLESFVDANDLKNSMRVI